MTKMTGMAWNKCKHSTFSHTKVQKKNHNLFKNSRFTLTPKIMKFKGQNLMNNLDLNIRSIKMEGFIITNSPRRKLACWISKESPTKHHF